MHVDVTFAERIGAPSEIFTGKGSAVPKAVINVVQTGTSQNRAWMADDSLLGRQFACGIIADARTASGADALEIQMANIAVYATGSGCYFVLLFVLS
jgi:hypothetical protein